MTSLNYARRLSVFYATLFLIYGFHLPYFPVWLRARGLDVETISWVLAAPLFLRIFINPLIARNADRTGSYKSFIFFLGMMTLSSTVLLSQLRDAWLIVTISMVLTISFTAIMPLTETITISGLRTLKLDYGRMRLWGSASFILASFIGGSFIDNFGQESVIWLLLVAAAFTVASATLLPTTRSPSRQRNSMLSKHLSNQSHKSSANSVLYNPSKPQGFKPDNSLTSKLFILFLFCAGVSQASHATYYAFGTIHWLDLGISPVWVGILWAVGVIAEITLFMYSRAISAYLGPAYLMILGALGGLVRWVAMAFDPPLAALIPLQILHGLTYGATHLGAIHFISQAIPENKTATAQAFYGGVGNGIAMALATLVSGWLFAKYASFAYLAMAFLSLVAFLAGVQILRIWQGKKQDSMSNR